MRTTRGAYKIQNQRNTHWRYVPRDDVPPEVVKQASPNSSVASVSSVKLRASASSVTQLNTPSKSKASASSVTQLNTPSKSPSKSKASKSSSKSSKSLQPIRLKRSHPSRFGVLPPKRKGQLRLKRHKGPEYMVLQQQLDRIKSASQVQRKSKRIPGRRRLRRVVVPRSKYSLQVLQAAFEALEHAEGLSEEERSRFQEREREGMERVFRDLWGPDSKSWAEFDVNDKYKRILTRVRFEGVHGRRNDILGYMWAQHKPRLHRKRFHEWLGSFSLIDYMNHVAEKHKHFRFLGVHRPLKKHAQTVAREILHLPEHYTQAGLIMNTASGTGSHWVAVWISLRRRRVEYFDSMGNPPKSSRMGNTFMTALVDTLWHESGKLWFIVWSSVKHQRRATECGMYALWFLTERLHKRSMQHLNRVRMPDKAMCRLRYKYFRPVD